MSVFEEVRQRRCLYQGSHFFIIADGYPVSPGHCLVVSNRVAPTFVDLTEEEHSELGRMVVKTKQLIERSHAPTGYNIGINCGVSAGQIVMHFHCHVIPRYDGDVSDPRGGVRHCVLGKGYY